MIVIHNGDLFDSGAPAIGHGVNCAGVMGAGVAKEIRRRYPEAYRQYREVCRRGDLRPGEVLLYFDPDPKGPVLVNLATQDLPGPHAKPDWIRESLQRAVDELSDIGIDSLATPLVGCGIGGLEIEAVLNEFKAVDPSFWGFRFDIYVPDTRLADLCNALSTFTRRRG